MKNPDQVSQHHADTQKQFAVDQIVRRVEQALDDPAQFRPGNMPIPHTNCAGSAIDSVALCLNCNLQNDVMQEVYQRINASGWQVRMYNGNWLIVARTIIW